MVYSYFIILDTDNDLNFHIECTSMEYRLRFSAMKSCFKRRTEYSAFTFVHKECINVNTNSKNEPAYFKIFRTNYIYYLLEKQSFDTLTEALEYKRKLIAERCKNEQRSSIKDKFTLSFSSY